MMRSVARTFKSKDRETEVSEGSESISRRTSQAHSEVSVEVTLSVKKRLFKRLEEWQAVISPKLKIVWSMLQMLTLLGICFGVQWPAQYEEVVRAVEEGVNLNFLKLVTVSCWQEWTWHHTLLLRTLAPSALILLLMGVVSLARLANG